ncbi:MAG: PP2C family protein-serine/threonine phosphatase [Mucilaginibacter sp.]
MFDNYHGLTDTGKQRQNNEDAFIARYTADNRYIIACVIDGVGGYSGGEIAAALAQETVLEKLSSPAGDIAQLLVDVFHIANDKIWEEKQTVREHGSMACVATLAVADLEANQFYYAHIGDTRLYLLRDGSLVKISHDQSFVGFLEESGRLTEKEAMQHPKRNEIDKALGFKATADKKEEDVESGQSPFLPGDLLLLCSDGLTDMVDKETISHILNTDAPLKEKATQLIDAANENGGKDNVTVVLVQNNKPTKKHAPTKPVENVQVIKETNVTPPAAAIEKKAEPVSSNTQTKWTTYMLITLVVALLVICIGQYLGYRQNDTKSNVTVVIPVVKLQNAQEIRLQNAIDSCKGKLLLLSDTVYKSPVVISRPINIKHDTLFIKAKGNIVFQGDTGLHGPAFSLSPSAKLIIMDSLSFKQFDVAIAGYNSALQLKNVRFVNCKYQLRNVFSFPDNKYINGSLVPVAFKSDSLPKIK